MFRLLILAMLLLSSSIGAQIRTGGGGGGGFLNFGFFYYLHAAKKLINLTETQWKKCHGSEIELKSWTELYTLLSFSNISDIDPGLKQGCFIEMPENCLLNSEMIAAIGEVVWNPQAYVYLGIEIQNEELAKSMIDFFRERIPKPQQAVFYER